MRRAVKSSSEIPLCVGQLTGRCGCSVLCLCPSVFDVCVCVALEIVEVNREVLIVSVGQKYLSIVSLDSRQSLKGRHIF